MSLIKDLEQINHDIPLSVAIEMTKKFRSEKKKILKPEYEGKDILPHCETFSRSAFDEILQQPGCVAVRAYFAMDNDKNVKLIFVGVTDKNEDILPLSEGSGISASGSRSAGGVIKEEGQRCPPICPTGSPLIQP